MLRGQATLCPVQSSLFSFPSPDPGLLKGVMLLFSFPDTNSDRAVQILYFSPVGGGKGLPVCFLADSKLTPPKVECEGTPAPTQGRLLVGSFEDAVEQLEAGKAMPAKDSLPGWDRIAWDFIV